MTEEEEASPDTPPQPLDTEEVPTRPPSSSYAPQSLTPFEPIQVPDLPDSPTRGAPPSPVQVYGFLLAVALVAFLLGGIIVLVMTSG